MISSSGKGKINPYKKLLKLPIYQDAFIELGRSWDLSKNAISQIEAFTCSMYGYPKMKSVNEVQAAMQKNMVNKKKCAYTCNCSPLNVIG